MTDINKIVDKLENVYEFECEAGSLKNCQDWLLLKEEIEFLQNFYKWNA